jgi:hypothetical protein
MHNDKISSDVNRCPTGVAASINLAFSPRETESSVRLCGAPLDPSLGVYELKPTKLTDLEIIELSRELLNVYESGFLLSNATEKQKCLERLDDLSDHIKGSDHILVARKEGHAVAFLCGVVLETTLGKTYHLKGLICHSSMQGKGVGELLLRLGVTRADATLLCMHTQSLKMLKLFSRIAESSENVALKLASSVPSVNLEGVIDRGRYRGRCLYGDFETFQHYAIPSLDTKHGDALFVAGLLKDRNKDG